MLSSNFKPLYPLHYQEVWDYKDVNIENICEAISLFDWQKALKGRKVKRKNYIPH